MSDTDSDTDIVKDFLVESYESGVTKTWTGCLPQKPGPVAAGGDALVTKRCATSGATRERMRTAIFPMILTPAEVYRRA
jgi:hypothetical protein